MNTVLSKPLYCSLLYFLSGLLFPVQIAILITDGKSQDSVQEPAQKLRGQGVVVFAVGRHLAWEEQLRI